MRRRETRAYSAPAGQVTTFTVRPFQDRALFVRVRVFRSEQAMHAYARSTGSQGRNWYAMFRPHTRRVYGTHGYERTIPEFGEILIPRRYVDHPGVLTHECVHAAIEESRRRRRNLDLAHACNASGLSTQQKTTEERICLAAGWLVEGIVNRWDRTKRRLTLKRRI